jgi:hypothetical protein
VPSARETRGTERAKLTDDVRLLIVATVAAVAAGWGENRLWVQWDREYREKHHDPPPGGDASDYRPHRFWNAKQTVSEQMAEIYKSIRDGTATDEDRKRLKNLREQYIALSKEVEDVMGRLLARKQMPGS